MKRDLTMDCCKAFLIGLVVLGHVVQYCVPAGSKTFLFRLIYSFHMAAFMLVSGYVGFSKRLTLASSWRKFVRLVVPFVVWGLVYAFMWHFPMTGGRGAANYCLSVLRDPSNGLWFLWVLGVLVFWLWLVQALAQKLHVAELVVASVLWLVLHALQGRLHVDWFGFGLMVHYFLFLYLGYELRKREPSWSGACRRLATVLVCGCLFVIGFVGSYFEFPLRECWKLAAALSGSLFVVLAFKRWCVHVDGRWMICALIGQSTLGIYAIHQMFPNVMLKFPYRWWGTVIAFVTLFLVSFALTRGMRQVKWVSKLV